MENDFLEKLQKYKLVCLSNNFNETDKIDFIFDKTIELEKIVLETLDEIFELQEQNVTIYEKLDESRDKINQLSETVNELNDKLNLLYKEDAMPTPQDISYWTNFGHFPNRDCKGCGKCQS